MFVAHPNDSSSIIKRQFYREELWNVCFFYCLPFGFVFSAAQTNVSCGRMKLMECGEWRMSERLRRGISIDVCRQCKVPAVSCVRTQNGMYITTGVHHHMQITNCTETWNIQCIFHISCGRIGVGQTCVAGSVRSWPQILGLHSIHSGCCTAQGTHCSIYSDAAAHQFCTQFYA